MLAPSEEAALLQTGQANHQQELASGPSDAGSLKEASSIEEQQPEQGQEHVSASPAAPDKGASAKAAHVSTSPASPGDGTSAEASHAPGNGADVQRGTPQAAASRTLGDPSTSDTLGKYFRLQETPTTVSVDTSLEEALQVCCCLITGWMCRAWTCIFPLLSRRLILFCTRRISPCMSTSCCNGLYAQEWTSGTIFCWPEKSPGLLVSKGSALHCKRGVESMLWNGSGCFARTQAQTYRCFGGFESQKYISNVLLNSMSQRLVRLS